MSLFTLGRYLAAPALKTADYAARKFSLPLVGLDLFEAGRGTIGAIKAAQEGDAVKATGEGLLGYGSTIFAPQAVEFAKKNNPKIMKALDVVTPKKFKTGANLIMKGIDKLPLSQTAKKYPIRTGVGIFGTGIGLNLFSDNQAEAKTNQETPIFPNEDILKPISNVNVEVPQEQKTVDAVETGSPETNNQEIEQASVNQQGDTSKIDQVIKDLANQDIYTKEEDPFEFEKGQNVSSEFIDESNLNTDGAALLVGNGALNQEPANTDGISMVPKDIVDMSNALQKTILDTLPEEESSTVSFMLQNSKIQNRILEEKYKLLEKRKDMLRAQGDDLLNFDDFYEKFNQMAGRDVPDASKDYILLKFGLNLMTGRTDQEGMAGFLDVLGRAGVIAVDELQQLYQLEKDKREAMALKYLDYENTMKNHLNTEEISILNAESGFLDAYVNAKNTSLEKLLEFKGRYYQSLQKKNELEQKAAELKYSVENRRRARFPNSSALYGISYLRIADSKGPGGQLMFQFEDRNGESRYGTKQDMDTEIIARAEKIKNSNLSEEIKQQRLAKVPLSLLDVDVSQIEGQDIKEFSVDTFKKNISRTKTLLEANENIDNVMKITREALDRGTTVIGFKGKFNELLSTFTTIFQDVTNADIEKQIALLDKGVLPSDNVMLSGLLGIDEFETEDGKVLSGLEAKRKLLEMYNDEINDASKPLSRQFMDKVKKQIGEDKVNSLSADDQQRLFTAIRIAEVQLKYALANSFKGEDRLTEKNLQEFGTLTRFIGGVQSVSSVIQKLQQLNVLALKRLNYETRVMKFAGASDSDLRMLLGDKPYSLLMTNYRQQNNIFKEEGLSDITLDQLQSIQKGITE